MRLDSRPMASGIGSWRNVPGTRTISHGPGELLEEVPREAAGRNLRGFEWHYLFRLCHPDALNLVGHTPPVTSVAFSPDGGRLVTGSQDKTVKIWDSALPVRSSSPSRGMLYRSRAWRSAPTAGAWRRRALTRR